VVNFRLPSADYRIERWDIGEQDFNDFGENKSKERNIVNKEG